MQLNQITQKRGTVLKLSLLSVSVFILNPATDLITGIIKTISMTFISLLINNTINGKVKSSTLLFTYNLYQAPRTLSDLLPPRNQTFSYKSEL